MSNEICKECGNVYSTQHGTCPYCLHHIVSNILKPQPETEKHPTPKVNPELYLKAFELCLKCNITPTDVPEPKTNEDFYYLFQESAVELVNWAIKQSQIN
jgi:hypothetical protein